MPGVPRRAGAALAVMTALFAVVSLVAAAAAAGAARPVKDKITITSLSSGLQTEERATFKATYIEHSPRGVSTTVVFEQRPPASLVVVGQGELLSTGGKSYYCAKSNYTWTCLVTASADPLATIFAVVNPAAIISQLKGIEQQVAGKIAGITVNASSRAIAGQHSQCESVKTSAGSSQWCVANKDVLSYVGESNGGSMQLQHYTTSVAPGDFAVPAGANITAIS